MPPLPSTALPGSEPETNGCENLAWIAVKGGQRPLPPQITDRQAVCTRNDRTRHRIGVHERIARCLLAFIGDVLRMHAQRPAIPRRGPHNARVKQRIALLIDIGIGDFELIGFAAIGQSRSGIDRSTRDRRSIAQRSARGPFGRILHLAIFGDIGGRAGDIGDIFIIFRIDETDCGVEIHPVAASEQIARQPGAAFELDALERRLARIGDHAAECRNPADGAGDRSGYLHIGIIGIKSGECDIEGIVELMELEEIWCLQFSMV